MEFGELIVLFREEPLALPSLQLHLEEHCVPLDLAHPIAGHD